MMHTGRAAPIFPGMTAPLTLRDIFARIPEQALGLIDFYQALMRGPSPLSAGERELIYAYGSNAAGCRFCYMSHSRCAIELGIRSDAFALPPEQIGQAAQKAGNGPLLRYAVALAVHGSAGPLTRPDDMESLSVEGRIDALLVSGLTAYINRIIEGLGAYSSDEQHARNGLNLARFGYAQVRADVQQGLLAAGHACPAPWPPAAQAVPPRLAPRCLLLQWLDSYQQLVLAGPSGVPAWLRLAIRQGTLPRAATHATAAAPQDAPPATEPAHRCALTFAHRLVHTPCTSTPEDIAQLFAHGWTAKDVIDLVITAATTALCMRVQTGLYECGLAGDWSAEPGPALKYAARQ